MKTATQIAFMALVLGFWATCARAEEITLKVSPQELALLGDALGTMPYNKVAPLMLKLQGQVVEQRKPPHDANGNKVEEKKK